MADGITIKFDIPDFKRQLQELGVRFERNAIRSGANAAGQVFRKAAIALAPELKTPNKRRVRGVLKRSIYVARSRSQSGRGVETYSVSFKKRKQGGGDPFYGRFLEAGWIPRGRGRKLRGGTRSKALQRARSLAHGARKITEYAFLLPAFKSAGAAALAAFNKKIEERIAKENAKK